ncbi:unnamed protein product [Soboliphyme baturini]|uniref:Uncharacterized protein n=1 Tax=Soboliphyme baturini TaxID=241478 RepID=A0A183IEU7_9BILA|nr:unnamed protein product [Soboliphyme baturini]
MSQSRNLPCLTSYESSNLKLTMGRKRRNSEVLCDRTEEFIQRTKKAWQTFFDEYENYKSDDDDVKDCTDYNSFFEDDDAYYTNDDEASDVLSVYSEEEVDEDGEADCQHVKNDERTLVQVQEDSDLTLCPFSVRNCSASSRQRDMEKLHVRNIVFSSFGCSSCNCGQSVMQCLSQVASYLWVTRDTIKPNCSISPFCDRRLDESGNFSPGISTCRSWKSTDSIVNGELSTEEKLHVMVPYSKSACLKRLEGWIANC